MNGQDLPLGVFKNVHDFVIAGLDGQLTEEQWNDFERLF